MRSTGHVGPAPTLPSIPDVEDAGALGAAVTGEAEGCGTFVGNGEVLSAAVTAGEGGPTEVDSVDSRPHAAIAISAINGIKRLKRCPSWPPSDGRVRRGSS
jgi:hypothetical protein